MKVEEIKSGDVVKLKSGGPKLTVSEVKVNDKDCVWCNWFSGHDLQRDTFTKESLVKVESK